jgi:hypothetical protein|tara:strand:+ start:122 stop:349 length:228 start_codon:yes stop_codon:yes gene_type:complete
VKEIRQTEFLCKNLSGDVDTIYLAELADHDKKMWDDDTKLVEEQDSKKATLYFVRIRSLMDDNEYYKIRIITEGV